METKQIKITFDGPDTADHTMNVEDLGPALEAVGTLHRLAYRTLYPGDEHKPEVRLRVTQPGSLEVVLEVGLVCASEIKSLLTRENLSTAADSVEVLAAVILTVKWGLATLKKMVTGNDSPDVDTSDPEAQQAGEALARDPKFQQATKDFTRPAADRGIDLVTFDPQNEQPPVTFSTDEAQALHDYSIEDEENAVWMENITVEVVSPHIEFPTRWKWRFRNAEHGLFPARLLDTDFAEQVEAGRVSFLRGNLFDARVRVEVVDPMKNKRKYEIVSIRPSLSGGEQPRLDEGKEDAA